jgi:hypothetical protein
VPEYATREELMTKNGKGKGPRMLRKGFSTACYLVRPACDRPP